MDGFDGNPPFFRNNIQPGTGAGYSRAFRGQAREDGSGGYM